MPAHMSIRMSTRTSRTCLHTCLYTCAYGSPRRSSTSRLCRACKRSSRTATGRAHWPKSSSSTRASTTSCAPAQWRACGRCYFGHIGIADGVSNAWARTPLALVKNSMHLTQVCVHVGTRVYAHVYAHWPKPPSSARTSTASCTLARVRACDILPAVPSVACRRRTPSGGRTLGSAK